MKIPKLGEKTIMRETALEVQGAPLVVALRARYIAIRQKSGREWFAVDYETLYHLACKIDAKQRMSA